MEIKKVTDPAFRKYGKIVQGIDFSGLVEALNAKTPLPEEVVYEPSAADLEALPVFAELQTKTYGELPIQIGYCNGKNYLLNALEYHRSSEINVAGTDAILLVGAQQDITDDFTYDTSLVGDLCNNASLCALQRGRQWFPGGDCTSERYESAASKGT